MPAAAVIHCTSPGPILPPTSGGVPMLDLPVVDDGHRLEPAMRVLADATALGRGRELHGAGVVEEQERTENRPEVRIGEERSNREAVSYPVPVYAALDTPELLHGRQLSSRPPEPTKRSAGSAKSTLNVVRLP